MDTTANRTIVDYSLIESDDHAELVQAVGTAITEGWQPIGGVCVWYEPGLHEPHGIAAVVHYVQALVKYA